MAPFFQLLFLKLLRIYCFFFHDEAVSNIIPKKKKKSGLIFCIIQKAFLGVSRLWKVKCSVTDKSDFIH